MASAYVSGSGSKKNPIDFNLKAEISADSDDDCSKVSNDSLQEQTALQPDDSNENEVSNRLFVRNLPFSCTEEEIRPIFEAFGHVSEVHLPLDGEKKGKGYGFVTYMIPEHAKIALSEIDGSSFQGRLLHIIPAKMNKVATEANDNGDPKKNKQTKLSSFQLKREEERKKMANNKLGWNSSFVRSDTVVNALANRYFIITMHIYVRIY
jgi:multiple RNA-binding domain-containing protein 1